MVDFGASAAGAMIESSAALLENTLESSLDTSFSEGEIESPSEPWLGESIDKPNAQIEDGPNSPVGESRQKSLTDLSNQMNWPPEVVDSIRTFEEGEIYKNSNLQDGVVNDRPCLQNPEIDWNQKTRIYTNADYEAMSKGEFPFGFGQLDDFFSMTNKERALNGIAPLDSNGQAFELHHIGQKIDSPLAELTREQHRQNGNHAILHDNSISSEVHSTSHESTWQAERSDYWKARAEML